MKKNFDFELVNGFMGTMNNVNDVAQLVKAELLNTNNVVIVNGFRFSIGGAEGAEGYALYVETMDEKLPIGVRKTYVHKIYHLGKIRRGIDKYVADFLTLNAELGMYNTPMFVWENGKMVKYVELNDMEENNMNNEMKEIMDVLVWDFYNYVKDDINNRFYDDLENFVENYHMCADTENEYVCFTFDWDVDVEMAWREYAWEQGYRVDDAIDYYRANKDKFIDADDICEYMYELGDMYGVGIDDNCCGDCLVWVKNPCYVAEINDAPCLAEIA